MSGSSAQRREGNELRARLGLLTPDELGVMLDVTTATLAEWRRLRQGPNFVKTGKGVMYRESDVQDWLERNVVPVVSLTGSTPERLRQ